jgi:hypothetical protein
VCFSAAASFTAGAALVPAGIYCIAAALRKKPSYLGLAIVPLVFGVQQISEGFVWHALEHGDALSVRNWSLVFLYFALAFWPFWFSIVGALMESNPQRRWLFLVSACVTSTWFWILYYPLLVGNVSLTTEIVGHSIRYDYFELPVYVYVSRTLLQLLYLASVALPMALGTESWGRIPGLVLAAVAVVAALVFEHAFVSVWCFFAAVLATYLSWMFYQMPAPLRVQAN